MSLRRAFSDLLARLSVGRKLALIYLLDLSAVIFISGILIHEKYIAIDFARKEVAGNAYLRELQPLVVALAGRRPVPATPTLADIEARHGAGMDSGAPSAALQASLQSLELGARHADAERSVALGHALDDALVLINRVGNQSNLILDPDLDSYYTMSVVLLRFPELLALVSQINAGLQADLPRHQVRDADARTRYFILEGRLDATAKGLKSDFDEAFSAAADGQLRQALEGPGALLAARIDAFREAARALMDEPKAAQAAGLQAARDALLVEAADTWTLSSRQLDRLIDVRIRGFFHRMWLHLGTALLMLGLILTAVYSVAKRISQPLKRLSTVVDTVRRTGDHRQRVHWDSRDEIGRLVVGFNGMLAELDEQRQAQQELAASARAAEAQQRLVEAMPIPLMVTSVPEHDVLHANGPALRWLGDQRHDPWGTALAPAVRARFFQQLADRDAVDEFEVHWRAGDEGTWAVLSARRLHYQGREAVLTAFAPVNHLKVMEQRLELWAKVFEASSEAILIVDAQERIVTVNRAFCQATGHEVPEVSGEHPGLLLAPEEREAFFARLWPQLRRRSSWQGEVTVLRRDGSRYPAWLVVSAVRNRQGEASHHIFTSLDISDRKASEERIQYLAQHDVLTGLPNRSLSIERLRLAMQQAQRHGHQVAVLFIDLDRFKTINDSLGHHVGDSLLKSVAQRLSQAVRGGDTVCRLGGDEFIVVLGEVHDAEEVASLVERRLLPLIRQVHEAAGVELHVSCSVGAALFPGDSQDIDELMRHADVAMYQAKALGRDGVQFFTPELNLQAQRRQQVESLLRHAVERGQLSLHFQPRVGAADGRCLGAEALLRWQSPELGAVGPADFIPIAEESRLIVPIGAWVIDAACRQQALWRAEGLGEVPMAINLSAVQLRDPALPAVLREALERHGCRPASIELELTESTLMDGAEQTLQQLHALKALGIQLAVDDFGTGYSSLHYLHRFPIDRLKIDRSFVRDLLTDRAHQAITRAVIGLGHALHLRVVAEGVENEATAQALRVAGCDELQGFHFARPLPAAEMVQWLRRKDRVTGPTASAPVPA
jgi:diguanylate cyclase (GGDEF)-like protein/PAS domain S-box-containing protein